MDDEDWRRVRPALEALLRLGPEERQDHWRGLERRDPELARELSALLRLDEETEGALEPPTGAELPWLRPPAAGDAPTD